MPYLHRRVAVLLLAIAVSPVILAPLGCAWAADAQAQAPVAGPVAHQDTTHGSTSESTAFPVRYTRSLTFTTDEGTWMSVDVSPDGKTIVFDLLGDLYTLPIDGGRATRITDGPAFDGQPRFSPDGKSLVFVSDRGGSDAIWIADADGRRPRLFVGGAHLSPAWSPDGRCIAASKRNVSTDGGDGGADVMLYCRESEHGCKLGTGIGVAFSSDGRAVYFINRSSEWSLHALNTVYDRRDGRTSSFPAGPRPAISPDGKSLVFGISYHGKSALKIRDLATGNERWLAMWPESMNTADPSRDALPGYAFTPDGKALIIALGTKLWRVEVASGKRTPIPFTAEVRQALGTRVHFDGAYADSVPPRARRIRQARLSPDGRRLAFVALDKVWIQDLPGGTPRRLTTSTDDEYTPTWSPDGRYVAYATWGPEGGHIYRMAPTAAGARPERLTRTPAYFDRLTYTLDGRRLVALRGSADERLEAAASIKRDWIESVAELVWLPATGGEPMVIAPLTRPAAASFVGQPFTTSDTSRVYLTDAEDGLLSLRWDGSDRRVVAKGAVDDMVLSPDGRLLAVLAGDVIAVLPAPGPGDVPTIDATAPASTLGPTWTLPRHGADALAWTVDGRALVYAGGAAWYRYEAARADSLMRAALRQASPLTTASPSPSSTTPLPEPVRRDLAVSFARDVARGTIVLRGARLVTMKGHEIIEHGDLVITDGRIAAVGTNLPIPAGAHVVDLSGKTILPGYIDLWTTFDLLTGVHARQPWEFLAHLAYGVTTVREPGPVGPDAFDYAERVEAGNMLGPRYLVARAVSSAADAGGDASAVPAELGPPLMEQAFIPDRVARQSGLLAAPALRRNVFAAGAVDWRLPLTMAQDGFPVYTRNIPVTPLASDVVRLMAQSGTVYAPGLVLNDAAPRPLDRFIAKGRYHDDPKLARFIPHSILDQETLHRADWERDELYQFPSYAADAARIVAAGGRVAVATRGAFPGMGVHWELWTLQAGGMPAHDVLRAGTIAGAEALGVARDLGSLEPGKWADLQILDGNPLEDIRRTTALTYVMKSGRLYEAATLAEVWPRQRALPTPWWVERDPVRPMTGPGHLPPPLSRN